MGSNEIATTCPTAALFPEDLVHDCLRRQAWEMRQARGDMIQGSYLRCVLSNKTCKIIQSEWRDSPPKICKAWYSTNQDGIETANLSNMTVFCGQKSNVGLELNQPKRTLAQVTVAARGLQSWCIYFLQEVSTLATQKMGHHDLRHLPWLVIMFANQTSSDSSGFPPSWDRQR